MKERVKRSITEGGSYFGNPLEGIEFVSSGCKVLDLALGGGWAENRIANVVGDKSSGKTLLAIEASANFALKHEDGKILYRECESAFDPKYAEALGMPLDRVDFGEPFDTVEDLFEDLQKVVKDSTSPILYIVDSLDALSDRAEMERDMDEGSYGMGKAKKLSELFRRLVRKMAKANVTVLVVSQVRSNIGVTFGRNTTRSGGRALDFYASQIVYLQHVRTVMKTRKGVERPVGIDVKAKVDKNKVGLPFRQAAFHVAFGYGVDDLSASVEFLKQCGGLSDIGVCSSKEVTAYLRRVNSLEDVEYFEELNKVNRAVEARWYDIEKSFLPSRLKYRR